MKIKVIGKKFLAIVFCMALLITTVMPEMTAYGEVAAASGDASFIAEESSIVDDSESLSATVNASESEDLSAEEQEEAEEEEEGEELEEEEEEEEVEELVSYTSNAASDGVTVTLTGAKEAFPEANEITVSLTRLENNPTVEQAVENSDENITDYIAYDITLYADGIEAQPQGQLTVTFSDNALATEGDASDMSVYHVDEQNAVLEDVVNTVNANEVEITTNHFSVYLLALSGSGSSILNNCKYVSVEGDDNWSNNQSLNNGNYYMVIQVYVNDELKGTYPSSSSYYMHATWEDSLLITPNTGYTISRINMQVKKNSTVKSDTDINKSGEHYGIYLNQYKTGGGSGKYRINYLNIYLSHEDETVSVPGATLVDYNTDKMLSETGNTRKDTFAFYSGNYEADWSEWNKCHYGQVYQGIAASTLDASGRFQLSSLITGKKADLFPVSNEGKNYIDALYNNVNAQFVNDGEYYVMDSSKWGYHYDSSTNTIEKYNNTGKKGFWPFDEKNADENVNIHFGMVLPISFTINSDGKSDGDDTIFSFSGDDDVFVYIDGKLVLDLGGVHNSVDGEINFNTGDITIKTQNKEKTASYTATTKADNSSVYKNKGLGVTNIYRTLGKTREAFSADTHTMTIVYFERGGGDSNCKIKYNFAPITTTDISFTKKGYVTTGGVTAAEPTALAGATFGLYNNAECNGDAIKTATSGDNGTVTFTGVGVGVNDTSATYYIKEISAPTGYDVSNKVYKLYIHANGTGLKRTFTYKITEAADDNVVVYNNQQTPAENHAIIDYETATVSFTKQSTDGTTLLAGAVFGLYSDAACTTTVTNSSNPITATSDSNGKVTFSNLGVGTYYIKETKAPDGYVLSDAVYTVVVSLADTNDKTLTVSLKDSSNQPVTVVTNEPQTATLTFTKTGDKKYNVGDVINPENATEPLAGAKFGLYKESSDCRTSDATAKNAWMEATSVATTGLVTFEDLSAGTYYLQEISAPEGYVLSDTVYTVKVVANASGALTASVTTILEGTESTVTTINNERDTSADLSVTKTAYYETEEDYNNRIVTIDLSATYEGTKVVTKTTKTNVDADVVLVLDASGSMIYTDTVIDYNDLDTSKIYFLNSISSYGTEKISSGEKEYSYSYNVQDANLNACFNSGSMFKIGTKNYLAGVPKSTSLEYVFYSSENNSWYKKSVFHNAKKQKDQYYYFEKGYSNTYSTTGATKLSEDDLKNLTIYTNRSEVLKNAALSFVNGLTNDSRVAVIKFNASGNSSTLCGLTNKNTGMAADGVIRESIIASYGVYYTGTYVNEALGKAYNAFNGDKDLTNNYTVFFADGGCDDGKTDQDDGNYNGSEHLTNAATLKTRSTVYAIGFGSATAATLNKVASGSDSDKSDYVKTASKASDLLTVFNAVRENISTKVEALVGSAVIKDSIDSRFTVVDAGTGTVSEEGTYVTWDNAEIGSGDNTWHATIKVKAKDDFIGGNRIPTNTTDSYVEIKAEKKEDNEKKSFDQPTVNVKLLTYSITSGTSTIFVGESEDVTSLVKALNNTINSSALPSLKLSDEDVTKLMSETPNASGVRSISNEYTYGEKIGTVTYELTSTGSTENIGNVVATYTLKVLYTPDSAISRSSIGSAAPVAAVSGKHIGGGTEVTAISTTGTQTVNVVAGTITITKKLTLGTRVKYLFQKHGDAIFTFKITNTDNGEVYYRTVRMNGDDKELTVSTTLTDLPKGNYQVEELTTMGYKLVNAENVSGTNAYYKENADQSYTVALGYGTDVTGFDANSYSSPTNAAISDHTTATVGNVTFTNKLARSGNYYMHTDVLKNSFSVTDTSISYTRHNDADNNQTTHVYKDYATEEQTSSQSMASLDDLKAEDDGDDTAETNA